jgi:hypothetical protein
MALTCHICPHRQRPCSGKCVCEYGVDIVVHLQSGKCPRGLLGQPTPQPLPMRRLPGDLLADALGWAGVRQEASCACQGFQQQMNRWGWAGCLTNAEEIMRHLLTQARGEW